MPAIVEAFADLKGRFGIEVLGTMDDDELMVGSSVAYPWTAYIPTPPISKRSLLSAT